MHYREPVKFTLEVDITTFGEDSAKELGRILRYWGGNLQHYALVPGDGSVIYDSAYQEVGRWVIIEAPSQVDPAE